MTSLLRIVVSTGVGGVFYLAWLIIFLASFRQSAGPPGPPLWIAASVITAAGFTVGIALLDSSVRRPGPLLRLYVWPLVGCAAGAGAVVWYGPMLIVFGMIAGGAAAMILHEMRRRSGRQRQ